MAGDRFGGSPKVDNLVSQSSSVNLSEYKKIENQWAKAISEMSCLDIMLDDMEKLISACSEYEAEMPTEIKIIYDVNNNKLCANYQYDEIYSKTEKCSVTIDVRPFYIQKAVEYYKMLITTKNNYRKDLNRHEYYNILTTIFAT